LAALRGLLHRSRYVSKRTVFETLRTLPLVRHKDALQGKLPGGLSKQ
jgi:hypothetical protein